MQPYKNAQHKSPCERFLRLMLALCVAFGLTPALLTAGAMEATSGERSEMQEDEGTEQTRVQGVLRIMFSDKVDPGTLMTLHKPELTGTMGDELRSLLQSVGGTSLKSVYQVNADEIHEDKYGFARDFELRLKGVVDPEAAIEILSASPLVKSVRKVLIRESSTN